MGQSKVIVASRASKLAIRQSEMVIKELSEASVNYDYEIKEIKTLGDKVLDVSLDKIEGKGFFVKEIEQSLLDNESDFAVHSMKDVPTDIPKGLEVITVLEREDVRDALVSKDNVSFWDLPKGARIGTSSLRRRALLLNLRSDLIIEPIRGNVQTRLKKLETMGLDGIVLAAAGLKRVGLDNLISYYFPTNEITPSVGQGALGLEYRSNDSKIIELVDKIHDTKTQIVINGERAFMKTLEGGCHIPMGCYAQIIDDRIYLMGVVASIEGDQVIKEGISGNPQDAEKLGIELAQTIIAKGGKEILEG